MRFIYEIAIAGSMMLVNGHGDGTDEPPSSVIFGDARRQHLWDDIGHVKLVASAQALARLRQPRAASSTSTFVRTSSTM
jgi:hypothetical protein